MKCKTALMTACLSLALAALAQAANIIPEVVSSFTTPGGSIQAMAWGDGSLWISDENRTIYRVSPTGAVESSYFHGIWSVSDMKWFEDSLWVHTGTNTYKLDSAGQIVETLPVGYWSDSGMAWAEGDLYLTDYNSGDVHKLDRAGNHILSWETDFFGHPQDMVYDGASLWMADSCEGGYNRLWQYTLLGVPGDSIDLAGVEACTWTKRALAWDGRYFWYAGQFTVYKLNIGGDDVPPTASVVSPSGGEYWLLSAAGSTPNTQVVTWAMADNIRICQVRASLWYSNDGGTTYAEAPAGGGLPATFGPGGICTGQGELTTSLIYTVPTSFPSGVSGSLYKLQIEVTDPAGNTLIVDPESGLNAVRSASPFYIVNPNPDAFRTLIVANLPRMETLLGLSAPQVSALGSKLRELAAHPRVQGFVVDLSAVTSLSDLYAAWDADSADPDRANELLFGCHSPCSPEANGIHDHLRSLLDAYTGIRHVVIVGDDRIVPMARLTDRGFLFTETNYPGSGELSPSASTVGQALAAGRYLSDDPLGVVGTVRASTLATGLFVPDLSVGRLVETPGEITTAIATFISQDGVLDLSGLDPTTGHKVLVTGYDFLTDSARHIRRRWKAALGVSTPESSLAPVDGSLTDGDWGLGSVELRRQELEDHLGGNGGARYGLMSLNGHASHHQEGVPGTSPFDITGLSSSSILGLNLAGGVIYAVGCHGGLSVPGSDPGDSDHSLDLPQTFLSRGVVAYVANTGYGWGLKRGIGYGERLVQILTEEMSGGGTVIVGDAVRRTKQRYYLETPRFDPYDQKSLMQWTFFGLPMYAVRTGIAAGGYAAPTAMANGAVEERYAAVRVLRRPLEALVPGEEPLAPGLAAAPLPSSLTRLDLHFDFSAPGVYTKLDSLGNDITTTAPEGCPDPDGCYYTLNGLVERSSGASDLPVQPYFIYDSRLSGTSQHGVLWKGGGYRQESAWKPVMGELQSNGGDASDHGPSPQDIMIEPTGTRIVPGRDLETCRPSDLELNSLVVGAGEALKDQAGDLTHSIERTYRQVDLEVFYFNNQTTPAENCDREGPAIGAGPFHAVAGPQLSWSVSATDAAGVWRVVAVYTDNQVDALGEGSWRSVELAYDASSDQWKGSQVVPGASQVTYVIQAVDNRGNVSWVRYENASLPASGVSLDVPLAVRVELVSRKPGLDFDGDGKTDLLWRHKTVGDAYMWLEDGRTATAQHFLGLVDPTWVVKGTGDYDGDGQADILWRHRDGYVYIWLMDGPLTSGEGLVGVIPDPDWEIVGSGDYDGNAKSDILWRHRVSGDIYLWVMNGLAVMSQEYVGTLDPAWRVEGSGDATSDGKADILWRHGPTGVVYLWEMNGPLVAAMLYVDTVADLSWEIAGFADFHGDLACDVLWRNALTGDVWLWGMSAGLAASRSFVGTGAATEWDIVGVGDQTGDGRADALWRHRTRGDLYLWEMEGAAILSQGFAGGVADMDWEIVGMD